MKKVWQIISIVLIIALALGMTAFAEDGEKKAKVSIGSAEIEVGEGTSIVEIPISFKGNINVNTLQIEVVYDGRLTCVEYSLGNVLEEITEPAIDRNPIVLPFASAESVEISDGNFAVLKFSVPVDKARNFDISVKVVEAYDDEIEENPDVSSKFETINGKIIVKDDSQSLGPVNEYTEEEENAANVRKQDVIALKIDASSAYAYGKTTVIDPDNSKVVPYLKNDRTLVPLRFVSETLGAEVKWEDGWDYCYVVKGDKEIKITFNSADIEVNGKVVTYDAPVEVVENRTMVPIRFISEELGYDVKWNQPNQLVIITPADNPWVEDRQAEIDALEGILVTFLFNGIF